MKYKNIFGVLIAGILLMMSACEPIEDRDVLSNSFNADNIDLAVVQATNGVINYQFK